MYRTKPNVDEIVNEIVACLQDQGISGATEEWAYFLVEGEFTHSTHRYLVLKADLEEFDPLSHGRPGGTMVPSVHVRLDSRNRKITFCPEWPASGRSNGPFNRSRGDIESVSMSIDRPSVAIAKDLNRRLLSVYLDEFRVKLDECKKVDDDRDVALGVAKRLADMLGVKNVDCNGTPSLTIKPYKHGIRSISVSENRGENVRIDLDYGSFKLDDAVKLIEVLKRTKG